MKVILSRCRAAACLQYCENTNARYVFSRGVIIKMKVIFYRYNEWRKVRVQKASARKNDER